MGDFGQLEARHLAVRETVMSEAGRQEPQEMWEDEDRCCQVLVCCVLTP